ncbi:glycosyltransferase BC10 [Malania oleifera]|uniref:glycosyltransferase BC10 n=1 Tax=Malania oleifera TaxID=397392 RepID=UPI0025ADFA8E|nr:glycosyltransferase BC10 [Malania oleifera]
MLSPNPLTLLCALLLCLPLAVIFIATGPTAPISQNSIPSAIPTVKPNFKPQQLNAAKPPTTQPPSPHPPPWTPPESDVPLLRRAARVIPDPLTRPGKPRKLAFMFLTTTPLPMAPLWELFFNSAAASNLYNVYVHADPSLSYHTPFSGVFSGRVVPSHVTHRHTPSLVAAARRLIAHALLHDRANAMFALLSDSCIPLHSFNFTYSTLVGSGMSFVEMLENQLETYGRWAARGLDVMLPEVTIEDFRIGSQFFALTRRHAVAVVKDQQLWSKFQLPCVWIWTCYPEENYFPTLLSLVDSRGCVPATLTHVDWSDQSNGHPHTYEAEEVDPALILKLRSDRPRYGDEEINGSDSSLTKRHHPFLFARKFGPETVEPLMSIANDVILKD